uniref:protein POLAR LOCALIZATION DURING ASYMMETRIC DIVISION AND REDISTRIBUTION isoform X2 n=1 Tax=Erigeron canadensis TaxID=72917 RepID=UPI001CB9BCF5|nr:protein POLAR LOCALIZATION DURING ASYMMETRIC DIVISION AND REDISTRIBUTION isoform X2 [Erigeron canadensis]
MWQVLLAAAVAGSGYFAKNLLYTKDYKPTNHLPQNVDLLTEIENDDEKNSVLDQERPSIFRFSSASNESKNFRKKVGASKGKNERKVGPVKKIDERLVADQRKNGKKFVVCLKKRRASRNASAKCGSFDFKDKSSFGYGVGVGMMYMMSARKVEMDRLNTAVDETAKVVLELKAEISKRKSLYNFKDERNVNQKRSDNIAGQSSCRNDDIIEDYGFPMSDEGGYASSVLTEEPHRDVVELGQLEAELECELLKLQNETSTENLSKPQDPSSEFNQCNGVMPFELDKKLCHLLLEQQESQIVELESELQRTNSKLVEKESELQALKDCVKRLTDFSLTCPSDDERECQANRTHSQINGDGRSMIGIKRTLDFD